MPVVLKALPFDAQNERDFEEMTERISCALSSIRNSNSLKATQDTLAQLARCSRRTLSLRRWPIDELKKIKAQRQQRCSKKEKNTTREDQTTPAKREKQLVLQIRNYQEQNGRLFDQVQYLVQEQSASALIRAALERELVLLRTKDRQNESEHNQRISPEGFSKVLKIVD